MTNEQSLKLILKKFWIYFDTAQLFAVDKFLNDRYIEYAVMKIFNRCPNSIQPLGFNIIYLPLKSFIVTELLTSFGGITLASLIPINDPNKLLDIFEQLLNSLKYLEGFKIEHNDIKLENILVDEIIGKMILRVIDFDLAKNQSYTQANSLRLGLKGFTTIYEAPEIYQVAKEGLQRTKSFSPWKAQIYSFGVTMWKLMGFFRAEMSANDYEAMKYSEEEYIKFEKIFHEYYLKNMANEQLSKILKLIEICISYKAENRLSSTILYYLIKKIHLLTSKTINEEYKLLKGKNNDVGNETIWNKLLHLNTENKNNEDVITFLEKPHFVNKNNLETIKNQDIMKYINKSFSQHQTLKNEDNNLSRKLLKDDKDNVKKSIKFSIC